MSTPQNDNSWTGWAISSFTNKLAAANGEIQPARNGVTPPPPDRASSVPPAVSKSLQPSMASRPARPTPNPTPSAPAVPRVSLSRPETPQVDEEDFAGDWGDMRDEVVDAWGYPEDVPKPVVTQPATTTAKSAFDDDGEPDFAGWLDAQSKAKQTKGPLPKGLTKSKPAAAPSAISRSTTAGATVAARAAAQAATAKPVVSKPAAKSAPTPATQEDEEDWGDAWG